MNTFLSVLVLIISALVNPAGYKSVQTNNNQIPEKLVADNGILVVKFDLTRGGAIFLDFAPLELKFRNMNNNSTIITQLCR